MSEYIKDEFYEGLGTYVGVIKVHPYNKTYYINVNRFVTKVTGNNSNAEVKEIEIERIEIKL